MKNEPLIIKKRGEDGNRIISVRIWEETLAKLDRLSAEELHQPRQVHLLLVLGGLGGGGEAAEDAGSHAAQGAAHLLVRQAGLLGKLAGDVVQVPAENVAEDGRPVPQVGVLDLAGHGCGAGMLAQGAEQRGGPALAGGVVGHPLEKQGQSQRDQLSQLGAVGPGPLGQSLDGVVGGHGIGEHIEKIHGKRSFSFIRY